MNLSSAAADAMNASIGQPEMVPMVPTASSPADQSPTYNTFRLILDVYIVGTLCFVGILGNVMSMIVLGKDRTMRRTTAFLLQMVAVADTLYLVTCLFFQTLNAVTELTNWAPALHRSWPYIEPHVWPVASIAQTCTVWLVLLLTADRYVAICKPLHANQYSTMARMRKLAGAIWILAVLYNIPRFFERHAVVRFDNATNTTIVVVEKTAMRDNDYYFIIYKLVCYLTLRVLIPLSLLAYFNTRLIQAIKQSHRLSENMNNMSHGSSHEARPRPDKNRHTLTLVVVVIVFVVCETPDVLLRIWVALKNLDLLPTPTAAKYVNTVSNLFLTINSCVNFVIYCLLGAKFRSILMQMCCKRRRKRNELGRYVTVQKESMNTCTTSTTNATTEEMTILMNHSTH